jgi:hypothetical protein
MRLLGVLVVALILYFAVPLLWERAMVHKVVEMEKGPPAFAVASEPIPTVDASNVVNQINAPAAIDTRKYEAIAVQSRADEAMRRSEAAQDQAWQATHTGMH